MKNWIIKQSTQHYKRTIIISILLTFIMTTGIRFVTIDDDIMKLMPEDLPSRIIWNDIEEEFGSTDFMYIAFGRKGENILNSEALNKVLALTETLESLENVEEVISVTNMKKIESEDGFMLVDDLVPGENLSPDTSSCA